MKPVRRTVSDERRCAQGFVRFSEPITFKQPSPGAVCQLALRFDRPQSPRATSNSEATAITASVSVGT
jgi:hypothetical protein